MRAVKFYALCYLLLPLYLVPLFPLGVFREHLEAQGKIAGLGWLIQLIAVPCLLAAFWLAHRTACHVAIEDRSLISALKLTVRDLRVCLARLPLVGYRFYPSKNRHNDDHSRPANKRQGNPKVAS